MRVLFLVGCLMLLTSCKTEYEDDGMTRMRNAEPDCHQMYGNSEHCSGRDTPLSSFPDDDNK